MNKDNFQEYMKMKLSEEDVNSSDMDEFLIKNWNSPEGDDIMYKLLDNSEFFDPVNASRGYSLFRTRIKEHKVKVRKERIRKIISIISTVAAAILLPVALLMYFLGSKHSEVDWIEANTNQGQTLEVLLPDGSGIILGPSSKLIYPSAFNSKERKAFIIGSAYVSIAKDIKKPFILSAGNLDVLVHGTEFNINSYEKDSEVEIALVEGSISLLNKADYRKVNMCPGEIVCFDKNTGNFIRKNFAAGYYKDILSNGGFQFINKRFEDIAYCLERHFDVIINIEDDKIREERYFASFINNESLDEILTILNAQNYMKIERKGKTIQISHNN